MTDYFQFPAIRTLGGSSANPLTSKQDAAKTPGHVLPYRKPPAASQPLETGLGAPNPTAKALIDQSKKTVGELNTGSRAVKLLLLDASAGLITKQDKDLQRLRKNLPEIDLEDLQRNQIEKLQERKNEDSLFEERKAASQRGMEDSRKERSTEAASLYLRIQEEAKSRLAETLERSEPAERASADTKAPDRGTRTDLASGGATKAEKGDPGVNALA